VPVGLDDYVSYFIRNFSNFVYLKWRFPHSSGFSSSLIEFRGRKKVKEKILFTPSVTRLRFLYFLLLPVIYLIYFLQALVLFRNEQRHHFTVFMGANYFCTFCGIVLKKLHKVDYVIYRVLDFFPLPPREIYRLLNRLFYVIDKFCLKHSDYIWFTSEGHIVGRERYMYFNRDQFKKKYLIIPLGINTEKFILKSVFERKPRSLVYCGVISKYHLLDLLLQVIQELKRDFPDITLNVIGSGPDESYFRSLVKKMNLQDNVIFRGFIEDFELLEKLIANSVLGVALYRNEENYMKYTEPAKVKYYLSFGVPVIVSKVPPIAVDLDKKRISFAVENKKDEIEKIVKEFFRDRKMQEEYVKNIGEYVPTVDINRLLDDAFRKTFPLISILKGDCRK